MADEKGRYRDPTTVLKEIENEIERLKSGRKEEIEKKLKEKIQHEQNAAAAEISRMEQEYQQGQDGVKKYEEMIADYDAARVELQGRIREHLGRVEQSKAEIAGSALSAATSLREVERQHSKFLDLRRIVEERATMLQTQLAEKFSMSVQLPERQAADELKVDIDEELGWFQRIINELEGKPTPAPARPSRGEARPAAPAPPAAAKPAPKPAEPVRPEPQKAAPAAGKGEQKPSAPGAAAAGADPGLGRLRDFLHYDPTDHAGEMRYFQKDDTIILDSEFIIGAMRDGLDATRVLFERIGQTRISKDQFFIKQEIVNLQEVLRKIVQRGVRMCENDECRLPAFTLDIVNLTILKSFLEMLNVGNWSTEEDFHYFVKFADRVKNAFYARVTPPDHYYAAVLTELEA